MADGLKASERTFKHGDLIKLISVPWNQFSGELVLVDRVDDDGRGFSFVIPERRGHAMNHHVEYVLAHDMKIPRGA